MNIFDQHKLFKSFQHKQNKQTLILEILNSVNAMKLSCCIILIN